MTSPVSVTLTLPKCRTPRGLVSVTLKAFCEIFVQAMMSIKSVFSALLIRFNKSDKNGS